MKLHKSLVQRPLVALSALAIVAGAAVPGLVAQHASAAGLVYLQSRSIKMSDATPGATGVKYTVTFTTATTGVIQGIDVDFCGGNVNDTPLYADTNCTIPTGMNLAGVGVVSPVTSGLNPLTGWSAATINAGHTVEVSNGTAASVASSTVVSFELTGITNPTTALGQSFYARILTYTTPAAAAAYTSAVPGSQTDFGGIALATVQSVNITARVQETLQFCVSKSAPGPDCGTSGQAVDAPALNIGKPVGTNFVLDASGVYTDVAHTQLSTNAFHGVVVRLKTTSSTTCAGLSSDAGATCSAIPAVASGALTPQTITAGTAAFGLCVANTNAGTSATLPYDDPGCTKYGMDDTNVSGTKATSTYGSQIFSSAGPVNNAADSLTYAATASNVTPAGIYSTTQSLIATATF